MSTEERLEKLEKELARAKRRYRRLLGGIGLCLGILVVAWAFGPGVATAQPAGAQGGDDQELRLLRAENTMFKSTIEALRAEAAKLKAENARLRALLKQAGIDPDKPDTPSIQADAPSTQPDAPKVPPAGGNETVAKAAAEYLNKLAKAKASNATNAQKQKIDEEFVNAASGHKVTITYVVSDVTIEDDNTASVWTGQGAIKSSLPGAPEIKTSSLKLSVRIARAAALQINKGSPFTVTGTLRLAQSDNEGYKDFGRMALGGRAGDYDYMFIQNGFAASLDGKPADVTVLSP